MTLAIQRSELSLVRYERLSPVLGAAVELEAPTVDGQLHPSAVVALADGLLEHKVLMLDGRDLSPQGLVALARGIGRLGPRHHHYNSHPDHPDLTILDWGEDRKPDAGEWHADMTYRPEPPAVTILQSVIAPPVGGDTLFACLHAVHDALPSGLRTDLAELSAVHDMGAFRTPAYLAGGNQGVVDALSSAGSAVHPVIAHHPVTGRPYINVSESFTRFIIGLSAAESARILNLIFDLVGRPDHQIRLRWRPGTVVLWDNRGTQHYAVGDYLPHRRVMHRVVVDA